MGAQQVKERSSNSSGGGLVGLAGSSIRQSKTKPRAPKDSQRTLGSNIFTEHNGEYSFASQKFLLHRQLMNKNSSFTDATPLCICHIYFLFHLNIFVVVVVHVD